MDIIKLITDQLKDKDTLKMLGQSVKADPTQVQKVAQLGVPALLQALGRNASSPEGAQALAGALDNHQDDKVDDVKGFLNNVNTDDGAKILQHIFADKNDRVQKNLAKQTGLKSNQVSGIMTQIAPLLLGALGKEKQEQKVDSSGVAGLIGGLLNQGDNDSGLMGMVTNLLDSDNDGSIVDEVGGLLKGFFKKK